MPKLTTITIRLFIVLLLLDGLADIFIYGYTLAANSMPGALDAISRNINPDSNKIDDTIGQWKSALTSIGHKEIPGIGIIPPQSETAIISYGAYGQRLAPKTLNNPKATGLLIGASQAQGPFVTNDETVSAVLTRQLSNVSILNYGIPGQEVASSILYWQWLMENGVVSDFTLLLSGSFDLAMHCRSRVQEKKQTTELIDVLHYPRLAWLYHYIETKIRPHAGGAAELCKRDSLGAKTAVNRLLYDIKNGLAFAKEQKLPFLVIIPPVPYGNRANAKNLVGDKLYESMKEPMEATLAILQQRLAEQPIPGVIDLTNAFDDDPTPYFIDAPGHLTAKGNEKLAQEILARVDPKFFYPIKPKQIKE